MTMRKYRDVLATVGEYTDAAGRKCKRTVKVGALFRDDQSGRMSLKLDLVPVLPTWSGWLRVVTPGEDDDGDSET